MMAKKRMGDGVQGDARKQFLTQSPSPETALSQLLKFKGLFLRFSQLRISVMLKEIL
jgi:hypothetical protein